MFRAAKSHRHRDFGGETCNSLQRKKRPTVSSAFIIAIGKRNKIELSMLSENHKLKSPTHILETRCQAEIFNQNLY